MTSLPLAIHQYESGMSLSDIARHHGTSRAWISRILNRIAIHSPKRVNEKFWSDHEDEAIRDLTLSAAEAAKLLPNRTAGAVRQRRNAIGLTRIKRRKKWSNEELETLRESEKLDRELAREFGVTATAIKNARQRKGIEKVHTCAVCRVSLGSKGKYCSQHQTIRRQIGYYKNRVGRIGGDISVAMIESMLQKECRYCGETPALGIDRVDSSAGYTIGNTVSCCTSCNTMKMDRDLGEWLTHMRRILEHYHED